MQKRLRNCPRRSFPFWPLAPFRGEGLGVSGLTAESLTRQVGKKSKPKCELCVQSGTLRPEKKSRSKTVLDPKMEQPKKELLRPSHPVTNGDGKSQHDDFKSSRDTLKQAIKDTRRRVRRGKPEKQIIAAVSWTNPDAEPGHQRKTSLAVWALAPVNKISRLRR